MVLEFPTSRKDWRLDAVGLLAIIGETTTETCVEPMTASYLCLLPRLIPAPQALIRPNRRQALTGVTANVVGVHNGVSMAQLSYTANQLFPVTNLDPGTVHVIRVGDRRQSQNVNIEMTATTHGAEEGNQLRPIRRGTFMSMVPPQPIMRAKNMAPHHILSVASTILTIALLVWAIIIEDGPAAVAIVLLACASTLFCAASLWSLPLPKRFPSGRVPPGDVVIRTRVGAFVVVQCDENIARELYYGSDEVRQLITTGFGSCVGAGTIVFMVAVILMGNATWTMQAVLAVTYLLLNAVYWFVALAPSTTHWEFPLYEIKDITPPDVKYARLTVTDAIWMVIFVCKASDWARRSGVVPETKAWGEWLQLAEENAKADNRNWDAVKARNEIMTRPN